MFFSSRPPNPRPSFPVGCSRGRRCPSPPGGRQAWRATAPVGGLPGVSCPCSVGSAVSWWSAALGDVSRPLLSHPSPVPSSLRAVCLTPRAHARPPGDRAGAGPSVPAHPRTGFGALGHVASASCHTARQGLRATCQSAGRKEHGDTDCLPSERPPCSHTRACISLLISVLPKVKP